MEQQQKFKLYVLSLFLFIGIITILEIFNENLFAEFFMKINNHVAWILGLTVGMVVPNILLRINYHTFF